MENWGLFYLDSLESMAEKSKHGGVIYRITRKPRKALNSTHPNLGTINTLLEANQQIPSQMASKP